MKDIEDTITPYKDLNDILSRRSLKSPNHDKIANYLMNVNQKEIDNVDHFSEKAQPVTDILSHIENDLEILNTELEQIKDMILKYKLLIVDAYRFLPPIPESSICSFLWCSTSSELTKVTDIVKELMQE